MKTIYYANSSPPDLYGKDFMLYQEPDSLYKELLTTKNTNNTYNNYMDCPAFLKSIQNTCVVRTPWTAEIFVNFENGTFTNEQGSEDTIVEHFSPKPISREKIMFNIYHNFLFFCEDSLEITTMPAYMHTSELQTKCTYIPGSFDISKWFRPIEGAMEMQETFNSLKLKLGDPLYYIKFNTSEPIKFVRFDLTPELWELSQGCVQHKKHQPQKALSYLYKLFCHTGMQSSILKKIKNNII